MLIFKTSGLQIPMNGGIKAKPLTGKRNIDNASYDKELIK